MSLPALRLAYLRQWTAFGDVARGLKNLLLGQVLWLPGELPAREREEIVDLLVLVLELPLAVSGPWVAGRLYILTAPVAEPPAAVPGSLIICERPVVAGVRRLEAPQALITLRDAIVEIVGRQWSGTRLQRVAAWMSEVTDTPGTAVRFADGALRAYAADDQASDGELLAAGLGAVLSWICLGGDASMLQWVVARATETLLPAQLMDASAALLGEEAAVLQAFAAGLVEAMPEREGEPLDFRRPLAALGRLGELPGHLALPDLTAYLEPALYYIFERLHREPPPHLGFSGPPAPVPFVGRDEILRRLMALFEPAPAIRTVVLWGPEGIGKTAIAARAAEMLAPERETLWLELGADPETAWRRVAVVLGLPMESTNATAIPEWLEAVFEWLRPWPYLLIIERGAHADAMGEDELARWLPSGPGRLAILVCSRTSERALQRTRDALALAVPPLPLAEARALLAVHAPTHASQIRGGKADALLQRLTGHPLVVELSSALIEIQGIEATERQLVVPRPTTGTDKLLQDVADRFVEGLADEDQRIVAALAICSPLGSPPQLVFGLASIAPDEGQHALERLQGRGIVTATPRTVRLHESLRAHPPSFVLQGDASAQERKHAVEVVGLLMRAQLTQENELSHDLVADARLVLMRMISAGAAARDSGILGLAVDLAGVLIEGKHAEDRSLLIEIVTSLRLFLGLISHEDAGELWAVAHVNLGAALLGLSEWGEMTDFDAVIASSRTALGILSQETNPELWAAAENNLAMALMGRSGPDRTADLREAMGALQASLKVYTREARPTQWARGQVNLAVIHFYLAVAGESSGIGDAITAAGAAIPLLSPDDPQWSRAQFAFGAAMLMSAEQGATEHLEDAIAALSSVRRDHILLLWARAQRLLARGYRLRRSGSQDKASAVDITAAIAAYQNAIEVLAREDVMAELAEAQLELADALLLVPSEHRTETLARAIAAYRAALTNFPIRDSVKRGAVWNKLQAATGELATLRQHAGRDTMTQ